MLLMPGFVLAANSALLLIQIDNINKEILLYRDTVLQSKQASESDYFVIGEWDRAMLFEYYVSKDDKMDWIGTETFSDNNEWQNAKEIWILGNYPTIHKRLQTAGYGVESFGDKNAYVYRARSHCLNNPSPISGGVIIVDRL